MTLLDTNILIEIYRDNVAIASIVDTMQEIAICDVVRAELFFGARNKCDLQAISADLEGLTVLSILPQISDMAVNLVKTYCLSHKLEFADALIAATAIIHNAELFTLNRKDFAYIPHLKLYEPQ
jgi:predicted nucleic acid-binding protein